MYKAIIVDDEAVVRVGLRNTIAWQDHGFVLVGDYANGREAWEAVELHKPELVISDISMPFMDGLELIGLIAAQYPYIKSIILTGFDEFEYAQQAIRLKVSDFILKPITAREIRQLLDRVKQEMDAEREHREDIGRLRSQLTQSLPLLKERFLERLVAVGLGRAEIEERFAAFGLKPPVALQLALVFDIDDFGDRELLSYEHDAEFLRFAAFDSPRRRWRSTTFSSSVRAKRGLRRSSLARRTKACCTSGRSRWPKKSVTTSKSILNSPLRWASDEHARAPSCCRCRTGARCRRSITGSFMARIGCSASWTSKDDRMRRRRVLSGIRVWHRPSGRDLCRKRTGSSKKGSRR